MGQFKFSLQTVLNHREDVEEEKKLAYQQKQEVIKKQTMKIEILQSQLDEMTQKLKMSGIINITELYQLIQYKDVVLAKLEQEQALKLKYEQELRQAQNHLIKAKMDVQVLEKVRHKKLENFMHLEKQEEIRMLDELACINYGR